MFAFLTKGMTISTRRLLSVVLLFSSSFAWFNVFHHYWEDLVSRSPIEGSFLGDIGVITFLISTVIFAFIGSAFVERVNRKKLLFYWLLLGIIVFLPTSIFYSDELIPIYVILGGLVFGLGFTSCTAFLGESTTPEERGRVAGLAVLISFIILVISMVVIRVLGENWLIVFLTLAGIKSIGFISLALDPVDRIQNKPKPWKKIFQLKDFNYYLLALILFYIAAGLVSYLWKTLPNTSDYLEAQTIGNNIRYIGLGIIALITGLVTDRIGRKKPIIIGLILLGVAYALVGMLTTPQTYLVHLILSGLAWGILIVVYLVIPADLSFPGSAERFYAIGWLLPIILYVGLNGSGRLIGYELPISVLSTLLSVILFASILPILYAAETLSESKIRDRRFRDYTKKVGKIIKESKNSNGD